MIELSNSSKIEEFKRILHQNIEQLSSFKECALLDYPKHYNLRDNLIWLGEIFYLTNVLGIKINYATSLDDFSKAKLKEKANLAPIFLHGGGNFEDLHRRSYVFREKIVLENHH